MALSDKALRNELRELISEAARRKTNTNDRVAGVGFVVAVLASVGVIAVMSAISDLSWWIQGIAAVVIFIVVWFGAFFFQDPIEQRHVDRAAERFRKQFPKETGDYDRATTLLRGTTSDSEVEKDLLKALGWDVAFADEVATELLGDFATGEVKNPGAKRQATVVDDTGAPGEGASSGDPAAPESTAYIPLDPYEPGHLATDGLRGPMDENAALGSSDETAKNRQ